MVQYMRFVGSVDGVGSASALFMSIRSGRLAAKLSVCFGAVGGILFLLGLFFHNVRPPLL